MKRAVVVVGSLNMDLVVRCDRAPAGGETVAGDAFFTAPGGKGANQAVAAARLGATVHMVGCVGRDEFGSALLSALRASGVGVEAVRKVPRETGTAVILVEASGENRIVVVAGANDETAASQAEPLLAGDPAPVVVLQNEIPPAAVAEVLRMGRARGARVLLNAAPARRLDAELLACVDHLIVNESEAAVLLGSGSKGFGDVSQAVAAARELTRRGVGAATLTLGARGAVHAAGTSWFVAAPEVAVVDTTAAGDAVVGALAAAAAAGADMPGALVHAVAAGALAVTRAGAQPSLPTADEAAALAATLSVREFA